MALHPISCGDVRAFRAFPLVPLPVAGLHLGALSALAVAQPLFDLISKNPDFLAARALIGWQVVALGLALALVPPLLALGVEALSGLVSRPLRVVVHLFFVALFVALIAMQALKDLAPRAGSALLIAVAAILGTAAATGYARANGLRSFVTVLSPAPAIFLAIFLFLSPVSDLTFASGSAETANVSSSVPVVMVVFDEVSTISFEDSRERIDPVLYPNLAALARDGTWFRYATAPTDMTGTATPNDSPARLPAAPPADPVELSAEFVHAARPQLQDEGVAGGHRPLPAGSVRGRERGERRCSRRVLGARPRPRLSACDRT